MNGPQITYDYDEDGLFTFRAMNEGVLLTKEGADRVAARVKELEAQVRELARENAELKQVPTHSDDSPRCPLRDSMTGEMGACEHDCMWLIFDMDMGVPYHTGHCAISVIARELMGEKPMGMRFVPIYEESEE